MSILENTELTNHLPYAMVRIHHLQQALQGVSVGDMSPLVMSSPELIKIMHAVHQEPEKLEEVKISNLRVPWHNAICLGSMEIVDGSEIQTESGSRVGSEEIQIVSNIVQDVEQEVGMQACPTHGMDHGIADPECVACKRALGPLYKHQPAKRLLPVITFDYSGPHSSAVTDHKYMLVVVWAYDKVRLVWAFPVESPDGTSTVSCLQVVMEELRTLTGGSRPPVLRAHSDRAKAFLGKDVTTFLREHDIRQTTNSGHDPKANGLAERWVGLIKARTTSTLIHTKLGPDFWPFACQYVAMCHNARVLNTPRMNSPVFGEAV
eukprot:1745513-Amphidinium_carterae.1